MKRKVALVTGSAKGIGKELIIELAKKNMDVIVTYNTSSEKAIELKTFISENYDVNCEIIKCDISKEDDIINLKNTILEKYNKIDVLINNAAYSMDNYIEEKTKDEFMKVLEINVVGTFLVIKELLKYLDNSIVVNISSTDAIDTYSKVNIDYSASKSAINSMTKTFALSYPNIKFFSVMPSWTDTESIKEMNQEYLNEELKRTNQERLFTPKEVAQNIIELIYDDEVKSGDIRRV